MVVSSLIFTSVVDEDSRLDGISSSGSAIEFLVETPAIKAFPKVNIIIMLLMNGKIASRLETERSNPIKMVIGRSRVVVGDWASMSRLVMVGGVVVNIFSAISRVSISEADASSRDGIVIESTAVVGWVACIESRL